MELSVCLTWLLIIVYYWDFIRNYLRLYCTLHTFCINNILSIYQNWRETYLRCQKQIQMKYTWKLLQFHGSSGTLWMQSHVCINHASLLHVSQCCQMDSNPQPETWTNPLTTLTFLSTWIGLLKLLLTSFFPGYDTHGVWYPEKKMGVIPGYKWPRMALTKR